ncbi:sensor domain-containing diguanylate cyclase [Aquitalea denitrificans]|uniref:sensor domain-containing diguanylate cyclase n=1 Tax=Aquitalea denitrificans TaxID=519081 RepID=UPI001358C26C|nr:diguanylate cyclase [Aquitalea denitrificans]
MAMATVATSSALLLASGEAWAESARHAPWDWPLAGLLCLATGIWLGSIWQRLRQSRLRINALHFHVQHSTDALLALDESGRVQVTSQGCADLLGHTPQSLQTSGLPARLCQQLQQQTTLLVPPHFIDWQDTQQRPLRLGVQQLVMPADTLPAHWRILLLHTVYTPHPVSTPASTMLTALQGARIGLCEFDLDQARINCNSGALHTLLGLPADQETIGLDDWRQRVHPEDRSLLDNALQNIGLGTTAVLDLEYRMQHADQHWEWLEQIFQPADASTRPRHVQVFSQVITPRKLAETAMRRRELEFRTLVENSSDIIARYDLDLRCQFINRSVSRYSPMIRDEHIGKTVHEKGWPDNVVAQFEQECRRLIDSGEPRCFEMELLSHNRRYIFETRLFPEFDSNGKLTSILSVDREITDSRQANRLLSEENAVMEMIAANQPLEDILGQICTMIESQLTGGCCSVMLLTEDGEHLHVASGNKLPAGYLAIIEGIAIGPQVGSCGTAAYFKRTIIVDDMENSPLWQPYLELIRPFGLRACWSTPLFSSQRELLGTFAIYYNEPRTPNPDEMRLVYRSSHITAIALQRDQHEKKLFQLATMDELTRLDNRRNFLLQAARELKRSQRNGTDMAVLMMDLDHFKNINDAYGHAAGDQVITHFAKLCRQILRATDLAGRLGGEEFAALLPEADSTHALAVAERLRTAVNDSLVEANGQQIHYTVSIGLSLLRDSDQHVDDLLKRADKLLYQAKHQGRNQVCHDLMLKLV